jgi:predicted nucleic acid-binding protein
MIIVDSCGWLEWFSNGALADQYHPHLQDKEKLLVPVIVLYEVYKFLKREIGEEKALAAMAYMKNCQVVAMDETLALAAADTSLRESLAMADAIILATAHYHDCQVVTSDADLKGNPGVQFIPKK